MIRKDPEDNREIKDHQEKIDLQENIMKIDPEDNQERRDLRENIISKDLEKDNKIEDLENKGLQENKDLQENKEDQENSDLLEIMKIEEIVDLPHNGQKSLLAIQERKISTSLLRY